jgi:hypothetical protein
VVAPTEKDQVVEIGVTTVDPMHYVVCVAPTRRYFAAFGHAASIADDQRLPLGRVHRPAGSANVEDLTLASGDDPRYTGVAQDLPCLFTGDRTHPVQFAPIALAALESLEIDLQQHLWSLRLAGLGLGAIERPAADVDQGVRTDLAGATAIVRVAKSGVCDCIDGRHHNSSVRRVEPKGPDDIAVPR